MIFLIGKIPEINGWYALIGFAILFVIFLAVAFFAKLFAKKKSDVAEVSVEVVDEKTQYAPGSSGEMTLYNVSEKEAAMVIAIVADEMQTPINELQFLSIRKKESDK